MAQIKLAEYTFDNLTGDCMPTLTPSSIVMSKKDDMRNNVVTRTIYIDDSVLPTHISFQSGSSLLTVEYLYIDTHITSMENMFKLCRNLTYVNTTNWNTSNVTNMYYTFGITGISDLNVLSFNTDKVTNMDYMFSNCSNLKFLDLTTFSTREDMETENMFVNNFMKVIYDDTKWKAPMAIGVESTSVTPPPYVVARYTYDASVTGGADPVVTNGSTTVALTTTDLYTGVGSIRYKILGSRDTQPTITKISFEGKACISVDYLAIDSKITDMEKMFASCTSLKYVNTTGWDVSGVTTSRAMFSGCTSLLRFDVSNLNFSQVGNMSYMFNECANLVRIIGKITAKPTGVVCMFLGCSSLISLDVSKLNVELIEIMTGMFSGCTSILVLDLESFDTSNVTSCTALFDKWTSTQTVYVSEKWTLGEDFSPRIVYGRRTIAKYKFTSTTDTLPTFNSGYTYTLSDEVNGDGTTTRTITNDDGVAPTSISFSGKTGLLEVFQLNISGLTTMNDLFASCTKLQKVHNTETWNTSNITDMSNMFYSCDAITSVGDLSGWDVSKVKNFRYTFRRCGQLSTIGDISNWNVSSSTRFDYMFYQAGLSTIDISNWTYGTGNFRVDGMFGGNAKLTEIKGLDKMASDKFTNTNQMFYGSSGLTNLEDIYKWDMRNVTSIASMFANCSGLTELDLSRWNLSSCVAISTCFSGCTNLTTLNLSNLDITNMTQITTPFSNANNLSNVMLNNCNIDTINTIIGLLPTRSSDSYGTISTILSQDEMVNVDTTTMTSKFWKNVNRYMIAKYIYSSDIDTVSYSLTPNNSQYIDINNGDGTTTRTVYNTSDPTALNFSGCTGLIELSYAKVTNKMTTLKHFCSSCPLLTTVDMTGWDTSNITNMSYLFYQSYKLTTIIGINELNTSKVTDMSYMFNYDNCLTSINIDNWDLSNVTTLANMFSNCTQLEEIVLKNVVDFKKSVNISGLFRECKKLQHIDVGKWNTTKVTNMSYLFYNCEELEEVDVSSWSIENVTTLLYLFSGCKKLKELNTSKWDSQKVTNMQHAFSYCTSLMSLDLSSLSCPNLITLNNVFRGCSNLQYIDLSSFKSTAMTQMTYTFAECPKLERIDLSNLNTDSATSIGNVFYNSNNVTSIGLLYCNANTVNTIANTMSSRSVPTIYYYDADESLLVSTDKAILTKYVFPTSVQLPPHIELRSLSDGSVRDELDLETGIITRRIGLDEDGQPYALEQSVEEQIILNCQNICDYGRILPTGVFDRYNVVTGEYYQVMDSLLLNGANVWEAMEEREHTIKFTATAASVGRETLGMKGAGGLYCDNGLFPNINDDSDTEHCCVDEDGTKFYIYIDKNRLMSPDLIGYQIWLQLNSFNLIYEMETPQTVIKAYEELDPTQARWNTLDSVSGGNVLLMSTDVEDDFIITPIFEYVAPSPNNFYLDLLLPNTEYTVYGKGMEEEVDNINLGGTTTTFTNGCLMTSGENNWITFDDNETFNNIVIIKGNTQNEIIDYFKGMGSIENPTITIVNEDESQQSQVSYPEVILRSTPTGVKDHFDSIMGEITQRVGVRPYEDGDLTNEEVYTDGVNTLYELSEPIIHHVDPKPLFAYDNGKILITSDTGLVTTLTYSVPFSNTYRLPHLKTGTLYTIKYPSASGTITIGDITYNITSNSMLFTTPLVINGDTSAIIFSDENPQNVILLEGGYRDREIAYFSGIKSVTNPIITVIDNTVENPENIEYKASSEIELRSLPNGIADILDIVKQKVTISVGYRPYEQGDEYLDNTWTDGYSTAYGLQNPIVRDVEFVTPVVGTNSTMKLSSNGLVPQLNYRMLSTNNFPLDLLVPNSIYTLYVKSQTPGSYSLGGVHSGMVSPIEVISLGSITNNLLTFNGDLGISDVMLIKGDVSSITVPYFQGIKSVSNIDFVIDGLQGEHNTLTLPPTTSLRTCGDIKDTLDLSTCILTKRLGEVTLKGTESWFSLAEVESINVDYMLFGCIISGAANSQSTSVICNRFHHKYLSGSLHEEECVYCVDNQVRICVKKTTMGGNNLTAFKTWLGQNNTTVIYALRMALSEKLGSTWTTMPPTSYNNQTMVDTILHSNTPKPMLTITVATTTLEQIVSSLQAKNNQLEEENLSTMMALTDMYEMLCMSMPSTMTLDDEVEVIEVSSMGMIYAKLVHKGMKSINNVPYFLRPEVEYALKDL